MQKRLLSVLVVVVVRRCRAGDKMTLTRWMYENENGVGSGSVWMTLGGNATAHSEAVRRSLESAANAAQAPPFDASAYLEIDDPERLVDELPRFLVERSGRYGVVVVARAERFPVWMLKQVATSFWGKTRCSSANPPIVLEKQVDCSRIAWFLSTSFGADALYSSPGYGNADSDVASSARQRWPSREAGSLSVKASRIDRCVFVRGEPPPSLMAAMASAQMAKAAAAAEESSGSLADWLSQRFVGQSGAVAAVASRLEGIEYSTTKSPAAFYFYGVAGSGKTRLASLVAEALGRPKIQLEMESYSAAEDANRLFGSPPGYGQGRGLVDDVIDQPRAVVILDEIEKAHPSIFREKLHSVLSEGVIRDKRNRSRFADVSDAIFVFTTNCFEDFVAKLDESEDYETKRSKAAAAINEHPRIPCSSSRPTNPFDDGSLRSRLPSTKQFPFFPLTKSERTRVVDIELERLSIHFGTTFNLSWFPDVPSRYAETGGDARTAIDELHRDFERALVANPPSSARGVLHLSRHRPSFWNDKETAEPLSIVWIHDVDLPPPLEYTHNSYPIPSPREQPHQEPIAVTTPPISTRPRHRIQSSTLPVNARDQIPLSETTAVDPTTELQHHDSSSFCEAAECDAPLVHEAEVLPETKKSLFNEVCTYALVLVAVFVALPVLAAFVAAVPAIAAALGCAALALAAVLGPRRVITLALATAGKGVAALAKYLSPSALTTGIVLVLVCHNPRPLLLRWCPSLRSKRSRVDVGTMTDEVRERYTRRSSSLPPVTRSASRSSSF